MSEIEKDCALGAVASLENPPSEVRMGFDLELRKGGPTESEPQLTPQTNHLNGNRREEWERRFKTSAMISGGDTYRWLERGVVAGLAPDNKEGRLDFAREMGAIMSYVLPEGGSERFREDLDITIIAAETNQDPKRVGQVADFMTEVGAIISREERERQRKINGYSPKGSIRL